MLGKCKEKPKTVLAWYHIDSYHALALSFFSESEKIDCLLCIRSLVFFFPPFLTLSSYCLNFPCSLASSTFLVGIFNFLEI